MALPSRRYQFGLHWLSSASSSYRSYFNQGRTEPHRRAREKLDSYERREISKSRLLDKRTKMMRDICETS